MNDLFGIVFDFFRVYLSFKGGVKKELINMMFIKFQISNCKMIGRLKITHQDFCLRRVINIELQEVISNI